MMHPLYLHKACHVHHIQVCADQHTHHACQIMITCDHTALHIFPSKQIDHLINLAIQLSPVDMPSAMLVSITFRQVEYVSYILV